MQLRWSARAAGDLEHITHYLFEKTSQHAVRIIRSVYEDITTLKAFPNRGRPGKRAGTRELVIPSLPYVVIYQAQLDCIYIVRILQGAQKWPA